MTMVKTIKFDPEIPFDIIFDILSRLPVKSLLRFKSVCKTWRALIEDDQYFIEKHHMRSSLNSNLVLIGDFSGNCCVLNCDGTINQQHFDINSYSGLPREGNFPYYSVVGVSNGLVCLKDNGAGGPGVIVLNPATRKFCRLPNICPSTMLLFVGTEFGSGFSYLLMRVFRYTRENYSVIIQAEMYNISASDWKILNLKITNMDALKPHGLYWATPERPVLLNEVFYWGVSFVNNKIRIARLDICNATYDEITTPESFCDPSIYAQKLINIKGEVGMILYGKDFWAEFWVLNDSERNWTKKFTIKNCPIVDGKKIVDCLGCNELIVRCNGWKLKLFAYNLDNGETKTLHFKDIELYDYLYTYTESLLSL